VELIFTASLDQYVEIEIELELLEDAMTCILGTPHPHNDEGQGKHSPLDIICEQDCSIKGVRFFVNESIISVMCDGQVPMTISLLYALTTLFGVLV
jgi:hypothetical protein